MNQLVLKSKSKNKKLRAVTKGISTTVWAAVTWAAVTTSDQTFTESNSNHFNQLAPNIIAILRPVFSDHHCAGIAIQTRLAIHLHPQSLSLHPHF